MNKTKGVPTNYFFECDNGYEWASCKKKKSQCSNSEEIEEMQMRVRYQTFTHHIETKIRQIIVNIVKIHKNILLKHSQGCLF